MIKQIQRCVSKLTISKYFATILFFYLWSAEIPTLMMPANINEDYAHLDAHQGTSRTQNITPLLILQGLIHHRELRGIYPERTHSSDTN